MHQTCSIKKTMCHSSTAISPLSFAPPTPPPRFCIAPKRACREAFQRCASSSWCFMLSSSLGSIASTPEYIKEISYEAVFTHFCFVEWNSVSLSEEAFTTTVHIIKVNHFTQDSFSLWRSSFLYNLYNLYNLLIMSQSIVIYSIILIWKHWKRKLPAVLIKLIKICKS